MSIAGLVLTLTACGTSSPAADTSSTTVPTRTGDPVAFAATVHGLWGIHGPDRLARSVAELVEGGDDVVVGAITGVRPEDQDVEGPTEMLPYPVVMRGLVVEVAVAECHLAFSDQDRSPRGGDAPFVSRVPGTQGQAHTTIAGGGHFV